MTEPEYYDDKAECPYCNSPNEVLQPNGFECTSIEKEIEEDRFPTPHVKKVECEGHETDGTSCNNTFYVVFEKKD